MVDPAQHKETTARKLIFLRKQQRRSQTQIAFKIGVTRSRYTSFETGRVVTPHHIIEVLCVAYGISLDDFQKLKIPVSKRNTLA